MGITAKTEEKVLKPEMVSLMWKAVGRARLVAFEELKPS
jgi:hypothetical protein